MIANVSCERLGVVLEPDGSPHEVEGVLNPGIARDRDGRLLMYPRAVARGNVSRIGIARRASRDDDAFVRHDFALEPSAPYERRSEIGGYGCEDARVTYVADLDRYLMAYTAFGPRGPRIALAVSVDAYRWERLGLVSFADATLDALPNKDAAVFPEVVRSPRGVPSYAFYHRPMLRESADGQAPIEFIRSLPFERREAMAIAYVPAEAVRRDLRALCNPHESIRTLEVSAAWGALKNGCGTPPIRSSRGWLSVFHGVDTRVHADGRETLYYRAGLVIHDLEEPHRVRYRSEHPFIAPETVEERVGIVGDVVFPTGIDARSDGDYDIFYGAADAKISRARLSV